MWYWSTNSSKSKIFFDTSQAACDDLLKKKIYHGTARVINVPDSKNPNYVKVSVRFNRENKLVPDFMLFPQERNPGDNNEHEIGWLPAKQHIQWGKL